MKDFLSVRLRLQIIIEEYSGKYLRDMRWQDMIGCFNQGVTSLDKTPAEDQ